MVSPPRAIRTDESWSVARAPPPWGQRDPPFFFLLKETVGWTLYMLESIFSFSLYAGNDRFTVRGGNGRGGFTARDGPTV